MEFEEILQVVKEQCDKVAEVSGAATGHCCWPPPALANPGLAAHHGPHIPADIGSVPKITVNHTPPGAFEFPILCDDMSA